MSGRASQGRGADAAFLKSSGSASAAERMPGMARNTSSMNFFFLNEGSRLGYVKFATAALMYSFWGWCCMQAAAGNHDAKARRLRQDQIPREM